MNAEPNIASSTMIKKEGHNSTNNNFCLEKQNSNYFLWQWMVVRMLVSWRVDFELIGDGGMQMISGTEKHLKRFSTVFSDLHQTMEIKWFARKIFWKTLIHFTSKLQTKNTLYFSPLNLIKYYNGTIIMVVCNVQYAIISPVVVFCTEWSVYFLLWI